MSKKQKTALSPAQVRSVLEREYSKHGDFSPGERPPYPSLENALDPESSELRMLAVSQLESLLDSESLLLLRSAVWDWYLPIRVAAVRILERAGDISAKDTFVALAQSDDFRTRFDALRLLAQLKDRSLLPVFVKAMESEDPRISALASEAVFSLGDKSGLESLIRKLTEGTDAERIEAAGFLATIEDARAEEAVRNLMDSDSVSPALKKTISSNLDRARRQRI